MRRLFFVSVLSITVCASLAAADDWTAFRGPRGDAISKEQNAPTDWGPQKNIQWKVKLPQPGNGSPIVVAGLVFVACAEDVQGKQRSLYAFDRQAGRQVWVRTVNFDKVMPTHDQNTFCGSTPVSDGQRVVVWHASAGLHCYDLQGNEIWSRDLGEFRHMWGYGSSPILYKDRVILHTGPGKRTFVTAINLASGQTIWETEEPLDGDGERNSAGKYMGSWCTPVIARVDGRDQIICGQPTRVNAYDPDTGAIIWSCDGLRGDRGDLVYSSPVIAGDLCVVTGGFSGPAIGFRMGGGGNITQQSRLWRSERNPQSIGSGVYVDGYIYRPNAGPGTIQCLDPASGDVLWSDRADGGNYWGSIVMAGRLLYVTNQDGTTVVFKPNSQRFDPLAINKLGETCNTTPAISDGQIFLRTDEHLFCIGESL